MFVRSVKRVMARGSRSRLRQFSQRDGKSEAVPHESGLKEITRKVLLLDEDEMRNVFIKVAENFAKDATNDEVIEAIHETGMCDVAEYKAAVNEKYRARENNVIYKIFPEELADKIEIGRRKVKRTFGSFMEKFFRLNQGPSTDKYSWFEWSGLHKSSKLSVEPSSSQDSSSTLMKPEEHIALQTLSSSKKSNLKIRSGRNLMS